MEIKLLPAKSCDKTYFEMLNILSYREIIIEQLGEWDKLYQSQKFSKKWKERGYEKIMVNGELVGGIWVDVFESHHQLREIQIHPDFRRQGIGTQLITSEIENTTNKGKILKLNVLITSPAVNLYKRLGFVITKENDVQYQMEYGS